MIGHEERVELSLLQLLSEALQVRKIEIGVRRAAGIAPSGGVNADRAHECAEPHLS